MPIFGRRVTVQLGTAGSVGKSFDGLRVRFNVEMTDSSTPNKAKIEIYGLAADTVATMQKPDAVVRLLVGYASDVPRLIFQGNPIADGVESKRTGPERTLSIEAQDGGSAWQTSTMDESYSGDTSIDDFAARAAEAMGVAVGTIDLGGSTVNLPSGVSASGPTRSVLDRIAEMAGARWGIRDGALVMWQKGGSTGEQAIVFSAKTGNLIDAPKRTDTGVEVTGLLAPTMRPGKPFRVESESISGDYVADKVAFRGDSGWAKEFYVICHGTPL